MATVRATGAAERGRWIEDVRQKAINLIIASGKRDRFLVSVLTVVLIWVSRDVNQLGAKLGGGAAGLRSVPSYRSGGSDVSRMEYHWMQCGWILPLVPWSRW